MRFLLGGRHGDFKFLPPSSYAPCYEALLPKEKMKVEPVKEYKRDVDGVRDLLGTAHLLSQASFIPTPVETSQVKQDACIVSTLKKQQRSLLVHFHEMTCESKANFRENSIMVTIIIGLISAIGQLFSQGWDPDRLFPYFFSLFFSLFLCSLKHSALKKKLSLWNKSLTRLNTQLFYWPPPPTQVVMPLHLEKVRDKLAENIHELWGMNKIELGWSYGKVRSACIQVVKKNKIKNPHWHPWTFFWPCLWREKHHGRLFVCLFFCFLILKMFEL